MKRARNMTARGIDPRDYQIAALTLLLGYGLTQLSFQVGFLQVALTLGCALGFQFLFTRLLHLPLFEWKSAMISGLSLCLLLRTNDHLIVVAAAAIAIGTKFIFRWQGSHIFNPTNIALVALLLLGDGRAWVSPGQWGSFAFFAFLMLCLGSLVVTRAARADVTVAFLCFYCGLLFARSLWLTEPVAIPLHRMQNGGLLLFAFFMISDPKTTPQTRLGRVIFALLVSFGAAYVHFKLFRQNGLLFSLAACSLLTPLINWLLPGARYDWRQTTRPLFSTKTIQPTEIYAPVRA